MIDSKLRAKKVYTYPGWIRVAAIRVRSEVSRDMSLTSFHLAATKGKAVLVSFTYCTDICAFIALSGAVSTCQRRDYWNWSQPQDDKRSLGVDRREFMGITFCPFSIEDLRRSVISLAPLRHSIARSPRDPIREACRSHQGSWHRSISHRTVYKLPLERSRRYTAWPSASAASSQPSSP